jgi:hypothetical protein
MKVLLLALALAVMLPGLGWALPVVIVTDTGCDATQTQCPPGSVMNCSASRFVVESTGIYYFDTWTACTAGNCWDCAACAEVYETNTGTLIGSCKSGDCLAGQCQNECKVTLTAGVSYTLAVCLRPCQVTTGCSHCGNDCLAKACIHPLSDPHCW